MLHESWKNLTLNYTADNALSEEIWQEIKAAHSEKGRYYHTLHHLTYMLQLALHHQNHIQELDTLLFSIFFHDFVYNPKRNDNEEESARFAGNYLLKLKVPTAQIEKCKTQILATKTHISHNNADINYLLDFDLAVLGDNSEKYTEYAANVRKEYAMYPNFMYKKGRKKVLQHFIDMPYIYKTKEFIKEREAQAKANLLTELENL